MSLWQLLAGSREGCFFDSKSRTIDLSFACHEVRRVDISTDEKLFVSIRDTRRRDGEQFVDLGEVCQLASLELETRVMIRVWAAARGETPSPIAIGNRVCGELRVPIQHVAMNHHGMLYYSWLTMDSPGLRDSVASIGLPDACDDSVDFDQKLVDGPRQLFQPRICITLRKSSDLGPSGELQLSTDALDETRVHSWGSLLRSHQQQVVHSAALHLQSQQANRAMDIESSTTISGSKVQEAQERVQKQAQTLENLKGRVQEVDQGFKAEEERGQEQERQWNQRLQEIEKREASIQSELSRSASVGLSARSIGETRRVQGQTDSAETKEAKDELERMRDSNARQRAQIDVLKGELQKVKLEANRKIDTANERIRALRKERDDSAEEGERLRNQGQEFNARYKTADLEARQSSEQKEALLRIVEDLHQACAGAGLQTVRRLDITNLSQSRRLDMTSASSQSRKLDMTSTSPCFRLT